MGVAAVSAADLEEVDSVDSGVVVRVAAAPAGSGWAKPASQAQKR